MLKGKQEVFFRISMKDSQGDDIIIYEKDLKELLEYTYPGIQVTVKEIDPEGSDDRNGISSKEVGEDC